MSDDQTHVDLTWNDSEVERVVESCPSGTFIFTHKGNQNDLIPWK